MKSNGQLIISDLLLYVIVLLFIFIFVVYIYGVIDDESTDMTGDSYYNSKLNEVINTLTKTEGSPSNWNELSINKITTVGLCKSNHLHQVSYDKLVRLRDDSVLSSKYFSDVDYIYMYPKDNPSNVINIKGKYIRGDGKNVYTKSTLVNIDYDFDILSINNNSVDYTCPVNHSNDWSCRSFMINQSTLDEGRYYLVTNHSSKILLSNTYGDSIELNIKGYDDLTDSLKSLYKDNSESITIHVDDNSIDNYLVYDRNNRKQYLDSVIHPDIYILRVGIIT